MWTFALGKAFKSFLWSKVPPYGNLSGATKHCISGLSSCCWTYKLTSDHVWTYLGAQAWLCASWHIWPHRHGDGKTLQNLALDKSDHIWLGQAWPHLRAHKLAKARVWRSINRSWTLYVLAHLILAKQGCTILKNKVDVAISINNITKKKNNDEQDNATNVSVVSINIQQWQWRRRHQRFCRVNQKLVLEETLMLSSAT